MYQSSTTASQREWKTSEKAVYKYKCMCANLSNRSNQPTQAVCIRWTTYLLIVIFILYREWFDPICQSAMYALYVNRWSISLSLSAIPLVVTLTAGTGFGPKAERTWGCSGMIFVRSRNTHAHGRHHAMIQVPCGKLVRIWYNPTVCDITLHITPDETYSAARTDNLIKRTTATV